MSIKYHVRLTDDERTELKTLVKQNKPRVAKHKINHAQILLALDENNPPPFTHEQVCKAYLVSHKTVCRLRQRLIEEGLQSAINSKFSHHGAPRKLDGEQQAHLVALVCSDPPEGRCRWTLDLLKDQMILLNYVDSVSRSTIDRELKKTNLSLG